MNEKITVDKKEITIGERLNEIASKLNEKKMFHPVNLYVKILSAFRNDEFSIGNNLERYAFFSEVEYVGAIGVNDIDKKLIGAVIEKVNNQKVQLDYFEINEEDKSSEEIMDTLIEKVSSEYVAEK